MKDIENVNSNKNMKNNIHENVIAFLINKRKELGISQNKIALELGLSDQAVSNWERGLSFPDISFLGDIAKVLETNVLSLIEGKNVNLNLKPNLYFDIERFSKYLYKLRKSKLLKQNDLGKILNVSGQNISKYENGGFLPSIDILLKYAEYFNISFLNIYYGLDDEDLFNYEATEDVTNIDNINTNDKNNNVINNKKYKIINYFICGIVFILLLTILLILPSNKFKITLDFGDGETLVYKINKDDIFTLPTPPQKDGYDSYWDNTNTNIEKDTTFKVIYTPKTYKITYIFENNEFNSFTQDVEYNSNFELFIPESEDFTGYIYNNETFNTNIYNYNHNITITGKFIKYHDVTIVLDNNEVIHERVKSGEKVNLPELPVKKGYSSSWDKSSTLINENTTFNVIYTPNTYKITYIFENDLFESFTQDVVYDNIYELYLPNNPDFLGYTYDDKIINSGKYIYDHDITIIGDFKHFCTVKFVLDKDNELTYTIKEGENITFPSLPEKKGYKSSWDNLDTLITKDKTYTVIYNPNTYKITYDFEDDEIPDYVQEVKYNEEFEIYKPNYKQFLNYTYNEKEFLSGKYIYDYDITVIGNCSNFYDVTIVLDKTNVITYSVKENTEITLPDLPLKKGYTTVWDHENVLVNDDTIFTVVYIPKSYTIKCIFEDDIHEPIYIDATFDQYVKLEFPYIENYNFVNYMYNGDIIESGVYTFDYDIEIMGSYSKKSYNLYYNFRSNYMSYNVYYQKEFLIANLEIDDFNLDDMFLKSELKNYNIIRWKDKFGNLYETGKQYTYNFNFDIILYPVFEYTGDAFEYNLINEEIHITKYNISKITTLIIPDYIISNNNRYKVVELCPYSFSNIYFDYIILSSHITCIKKYTFKTNDEISCSTSSTISYNGTNEEWFNIDFETIISNCNGMFFGLDRVHINNLDIAGDNFEIPSTIKTIKRFSMAFTFLKYLIIPESVNKIEAYALLYSTIFILEGLENVEIIEENAFTNSVINGN